MVEQITLSTDKVFFNLAEVFIWHLAIPGHLCVNYVKEPYSNGLRINNISSDHHLIEIHKDDIGVFIERVRLDSTIITLSRNVPHQKDRIKTEAILEDLRIIAHSIPDGHASIK